MQMVSLSEKCDIRSKNVVITTELSEKCGILQVVNENTSNGGILLWEKKFQIM